MGQERKVSSELDGLDSCPEEVRGFCDLPERCCGLAGQGGSVRLSGAGTGERAVESGEAPALGPELSDPGTRSRGQYRAVRMGLCAPGARNALCSLPAALAVWPWADLAPHRASDFPVYRRHVPGPSELVFKPGGGRGEPSVGQASNFLGRILKE